MEDEVCSIHPSKKLKLTSEHHDRDDLKAGEWRDTTCYDFVGKTSSSSSIKEEIKDKLDQGLIYETVEDKELSAVTDKTSKNSAFRICELDVGITKYINSHPGIPGILKQRYGDFLVREKDLNGKLVNLNTKEDPTSEVKTEEIIEEENDNLCPLTDDDVATVDQFVSSAEDIECKNGAAVLSIDNDKSHRTLVHKFIKKTYNLLDTETAQLENGDKAVKIFFKRKSNKRRQNRSEDQKKQKYCHFVLYKENLDTMNAVNKIAEVLHVRPASFTYAGTKDKRAITVQNICACWIQSERLASVNKRIRNIYVGSFSYKDSPLKLGDLCGNQFSIILRDIPSGTKADDVSSVMSSLRDIGFINYFGMQRFGSGSVPTFEIGKTVLQSNWKKTISLIMTPREGEDETFLRAKKYWLEKKDSKEALKMLNRQRCIEGQILAGLAKEGENAYYNAFQNIPRNTRMLYLHSYQSYVWNRIVSKRISEHGLEVLAGDLVIIEEQKSSDLSNSGQRNSLTRCQVRHVTQEDLDQNSYSITDVVMPLPGYDMTYPDNSLKELYNIMMGNDGFSIDNMKHKIKDYSLSGAYRYIVVKPDDVTWRIISYNDYLVPLIQTDIDVIEGRDPPDLDAAGELKALKIEFTLPPSSYATMAIREITKLDSSAHQQSKLNKN